MQEHVELARLRQLIREGGRELRHVEFRQHYQSPERIGEYISALSNSACLENEDFGYLYFGVEDGSLALVGTTFDPTVVRKGNQALELYLRQMLHPKIDFQIIVFQDEQLRRYVLFRIPAARGEPTTFANRASVRVDSHTTGLQQYPDWVRAIYNSGVDWSAELVPEATIADLDEEALLEARKGFRLRNPQYADMEAAWDMATFLDKARLTVGGQVTRTALLLLGKPEVAYLLPGANQMVWKLDTPAEKAGETFTLPYLLTTTRLRAKIRNYRIKLYSPDSLVPAEVWRYDNVSILEALHNCIAHQDYTRRERIVVTEKADGLLFENAGRFFDGEPEQYIEGSMTPKRYRNPFLKDAMVSLKMIDTLGYGIHRMYKSQKERFLPMPYYEVSDQERTAFWMPGRIINEDYSLILQEHAELSLSDALLLDRVQRRQPVSDEGVKRLRKLRLIEGKRPNIYVCHRIARLTHTEAEYSRLKGLDDQYYRDLILQALRDSTSLRREDFDRLLLNKLPEILNEEQRANKVMNLLQDLRKAGLIESRGRVWYLTGCESGGDPT